MRWRRKQVDLAERLRPHVDAGPVSEPIVDVDPIRMFLFRWLIETGDSIEVVARGFDLDLDLLTSILDRRVRSISRGRATEIRHRLGMFEATR